MDLLEISVDRESELPLGTQLAWKLRTLIATGALAPGARLPGIRELADAAGVNVNTVRSVFARLEEQGLLQTEQGRGTFVSAGAPSHAGLAEVAGAAIEQARQAGVDPRDLAAALYVTLKGTDPPKAQARSERRVLYDEIARLERELARLDRLGTLEPRSGSGAPRILTVTELRKIRDELADRLEQLRGERDQWRAENEELERAERTRPASTPRRREAGIWTGRPAAQVSWTMP